MTKDDDMVNKVIHLPVPTSKGATQGTASQGPQGADEYAQADTQRRQRLFDWADAVLSKLGVARAVTGARSIEELLGVIFDAESVDVILAIRDALHPANGNREEHFRGLKESNLKQILRNRFAALRKTREESLRHRKEPDWTDQLILDKDGKIVANLANLILILREQPEWKGVLGYDEFNVRVAVVKAPSPLEKTAPNTPWSDHHESQVRVWFQTRGVKPTLGDVGRAVQAAARYNPFHPVRDYFESLAWDGVPRVGSWLQTYLHVGDSEYVRAIGPRFLISAVARIYEPGCKVDHVLVLEGPQGKQKSEALRTLALKDEWFTDRLANVSGKDAMLETAGVLLVELAEMDALTRTTSSAMKAFLTRRRDRFRLPWGKHIVSQQRQCVFAATINPTVGGYLRDPTGARRFWPAACQGMIDRDGLEEVRDQLWAEAVHRFKSAAKWWLETPELEALATLEQTKRFVVDAWEQPIREWLGDRTDATVWDVLEHALGLAPEYWTQPCQKRVVAILTRMGFAQHRPRTPKGTREYRYQRDPPPKRRARLLTGAHGGPRPTKKET